MLEVRSNSAAKHVASFFGNTSGDEAFRVQDGLESIAFGGLYGGTSVAADLVLNSTTNAVKGRVLIANSTLNIEETTNRVGFRTVTPSTTFHLNGGAAFKYVTAVANYVFDSGATPDYIVYADVNGINITIPDAATNDARIVVVKNRVGAASSINIVSGGGLIEGAAGDTIVNSLAGVYNTKAYQSDGTNWNRIW
jgi:hypothetical protein